MPEIHATPEEPLIEIDPEGTIRTHSVEGYIDDHSYTFVAPIIDSVIADGLYIGNGWFMAGMRHAVGRQWREYKRKAPLWVAGN